MRILDATCGSRSMWYQKHHPLATYMDIRKCVIRTVQPNWKLRGDRKVTIDPDVVADFRDTPFDDEYFDLVLFDPPHLIYKKERKQSQLAIRYGYLMQDEFREIIRDGAKELFRVLRPNGILILKWGETDRPLSDVIKLFPYPPLFGTRTGQRNNTHWILFLKHSTNGRLDNITED